ncbi:MAG TPA: dolichyl-phosphate beta-glucosyltransferase [Kofleriaceae bacterium]|jgi:glycosyltransferase involved in cell wall biosynthesis|nr:dolichyl-phosphate beta-glucosyltransferase [Kofleriaceae bacterium]
MTGLALSVVVPAYNESARLGPTLARIQAHLDARGGRSEVVVVDDGSRDDTASLARAAGARVVSHATNRGKGAAVRTGVAAAGGALVLICDADLSTPIEELDVLEAALVAGADIAVGSRRLDARTIEVDQPLPRRVLGAAFRALVRLGLGVRVADPMCGFKLFTRTAAADLFTRARIDRWAYDVEVLRLAGDHWRVVEVPVRWRHVDGSRVSLGRDILTTACELLEIRLVAQR